MAFLVLHTLPGLDIILLVAFVHHVSESYICILVLIAGKVIAKVAPY